MSGIGAFVVFSDPEFDGEHDWNCFPYRIDDEDAYELAWMQAREIIRSEIGSALEYYCPEHKRREETVVEVRVAHFDVDADLCVGCDYAECPYRVESAKGES